jgi:sodium/hydrogen antiporter
MHGLMDSFSWKMAVFAVIAIFVVRPLTAFASVHRTGLHIKEKLAISFYGIKGIGSFFYLAFAITHATFQGESELWTIISTVVLLSIVVHGTTASKTMRRLENQFTTTRKDNSTEQSNN